MVPARLLAGWLRMSRSEAANGAQEAVRDPVEAVSPVELVTKPCSLPRIGGRPLIEGAVFELPRRYPKPLGPYAPLRWAKASFREELLPELHIPSATTQESSVAGS